ncbi:DNA-binding domain-containing protein [Piscinibacter sp.]|uniref:DNA-binding domain-containing protein n=1 Tax=Piscinibacter sp. TaxID=1903157 RepID=UPI002C39BA37|nr:DNA-binding domain-containing protein [Albitalea sp.]HUG25625.1 DNA-binding domain-containing protein [Albitalea sp.]
MTSLLEQQRQLRRMIVAGDDADSGALLRPRPDREPLLRIYRHAYTARLIGALRDNFGVLPHVIGDEAFDALALAYVAAHPSRYPSIRWFGDRLPQFMGERDDLVPHPALIDLARMEWALRHAFDAADATPLAAADLAAVGAEHWPSLVFEPVPSVQLLPMQWAVEPVWRALQSSSDDDLTTPEPEAHEHALLVWRAGLDNRWRALDTAQAALLRAMLDGRCLGDLCLLAADQVGEADAAATAVAALQSWLADGLLAFRSPHEIRERLKR